MKGHYLFRVINEVLKKLQLYLRIIDLIEFGQSIRKKVNGNRLEIS